ncbi:hypothetical protein Tco_1221463 [Tanacetum coccineum]
MSAIYSRLTVVNETLTSELARYKELVGVYEKRTKFELTEREQKIDEQMRIIISDRNRKETSLKSELHTVQMQLRSTVDHNKSMKDDLEAQLKSKVSCVTSDSVKPKVLAPDMSNTFTEATKEIKARSNTNRKIGRTGRPLVLDQAVQKPYDGGMFKAQRIGGKGNFVDFDLEMAFRKHSGFVRGYRMV